MNEEFNPLTEIIIDIKYYLFGNDTLIKILDNEEYVFDKIVEEWTPSNLVNIYKEKNIEPREISETLAENIISTIKLRNLNTKKELDFSFIEELVTGKRKFLITNEETNNSFYIQPVTKEKNIKRYYSVIMICIVFLIIGFGINYTIKNSVKKSEDTVQQLTSGLTLKNIVVVKNSVLPTTYNNYISEKLSEDIIKDLTINTSDVKLDTVGMYTYEVKYKEKVYVGVVIVVNSETEKNQTLDQLENPEKYTK